MKRRVLSAPVGACVRLQTPWPCVLSPPAPRALVGSCRGVRGEWTSASVCAFPRPSWPPPSSLTPAVRACPLRIQHTPTPEWGLTHATHPPDNRPGALWVWGLSLPARAGALRAGGVAEASRVLSTQDRARHSGNQSEESRKPQFPHLCTRALEQQASRVTHPGSRTHP